ncbi:MAG TPA: HutD family protein [Catalimonadaceae bacterium]|nr:HutD family protein [Catalimonadaceae bacterium]HPI12915.1 HutD family protein [Catalimonadaceae bacterium]
MKTTIFKSDQFQRNVWSGGTTVELFVFPPEASYARRDFRFRLSSATVESETSEFTALPGISRKLMLLSGNLTVHHEGHHSRILKKFEVDQFEGDWKTSSIGQCTDFNLMTSGNTRGNMSGMELQKGASHLVSPEPESDWQFVYVFSGNLDVLLPAGIVSLSAGDLLVNPQPEVIQINSTEKSELVLVQVRLSEKSPLVGS